MQVSSNTAVYSRYNIVKISDSELLKNVFYFSKNKVNIIIVELSAFDNTIELNNNFLNDKTYLTEKIIALKFLSEMFDFKDEADLMIKKSLIKCEFDENKGWSYD